MSDTSDTPSTTSDAAPSTPQHPLLKHVLGYPRIAERMAACTETAMFRRFSGLQARNLLYMQAELCRLEKKLIEQEAIDSKSDMCEKRKYATNFAFLRQAAVDENPPIQLGLINEIKYKLMEALLEATKIANLASPDPFDLNNFQHFFNSEEFMNIRGMTGVDRDTWGSIIDPEGTAPDLAVLQGRAETDPASMWLSDNGIRLFRIGLGRLLSRNKRTGDVGYHESTVLRITFWMTLVLTSVLPIAGICGLSYSLSANVEDLFFRQAKTMAVFNVVGALCLGVFTQPSRVEAFLFAALYIARYGVEA